MATIFENQELQAKRREAIKREEMQLRDGIAAPGWAIIRNKVEKDIEGDQGVLLAASQKRSRLGTVVHVQPGEWVEIGDEVLFTNFPMELTELDDLLGEKNLALVRVEEVYMKFKPRE